MGLLLLLAGLALFLGMHSIRINGDSTRDGFMVRWGKGRYRGIFSFVSALGLVLIIVGYGQARLDPIFLWTPPTATRHIAALLMLVSMTFLVASHVPRNHIKLILKHPMTLAVKVWALAHLLANGSLADLFLFASFLIWAVLVFKSARRRREPLQMSSNPSFVNTLLTVLLGAGAWFVFAMWLHVWLIGISPFAR